MNIERRYRYELLLKNESIDLRGNALFATLSVIYYTAIILLLYLTAT